MAQIQNFEWDQGSDLEVQLIYKEGDTVENATAVNLSSNYAVRMDIVTTDTKERVYTFNSDEIDDVDSSTEGDQADNILESVLGTGADGNPNISITVARALTLPGGSVYESSKTVFSYDLFIRNTSTNKQSKILEGTISVKESHTLWQ